MSYELVIFSFFYNRGDKVKESVKSLIDSCPEKAKIILVNDGSTDNTLMELKKFESNELVEIVNQNNMGFTNSLVHIINEKINRYSPTYIAIHGAGDICFPDKFKKQLKYMNENKDVVALGTGDRTISYINNIVLSKREGFEEATYQSLAENIPFTHGTVVYRTDAYLKSGGYNPLFKTCQDWDLYYRLLKYGRVLRYPEILYTKYFFEDGVSYNPQKKAEQVKYRAIVISRSESMEVYKKRLEVLKNNNVHEATKDIDFFGIYNKSKWHFIKQGQFKTALDWVKVIESETNKNQLTIRIILHFLDMIKIPGIILSKIYSISKGLQLKRT